MKKLTEAQHAFSIFHDGTISRGKRLNDRCDLRIDIPYLAENVSPEYTYFVVSIFGFTDFAFVPWDGPQNDFIEFESIAEINLKVLSAEIVNSRLEVQCSQEFEDLEFTGGVLGFDLDEITVHDQGGKEIRLDDLKALSEQYWEEWNQKKQ